MEKAFFKLIDGRLYDGEFVDGKVMLLNPLSSIFVNTISREYLSFFMTNGQILNNVLKVKSLFTMM